MSVGPAGVKRELMGLAGGEVGVGPTACGVQPGQSDLPGRVDQQDAVAGVVQAGLDQQRAVFDDEPHGWIVGETLMQLGSAGIDARVDDGFELLLEPGVGEDAGGDSVAVGSAVGVECGLAEKRADLGTDAGLVEARAG